MIGLGRCGVRMVMGKVYQMIPEPYHPHKYCKKFHSRGVQGKSVRLPIPRTEQYKNSVYYLGCKAWNDLKENVRDIIVLSDFKSNIM